MIKNKIFFTYFSNPVGSSNIFIKYLNFACKYNLISKILIVCRKKKKSFSKEGHYLAISAILAYMKNFLLALQGLFSKKKKKKKKKKNYIRGFGKYQSIYLNKMQKN